MTVRAQLSVTKDIRTVDQHLGHRLKGKRCFRSTNSPCLFTADSESFLDTSTVVSLVWLFLLLSIVSLCPICWIFTSRKMIANRVCYFYAYNAILKFSSRNVPIIPDTLPIVFI